jgi:membrane-associated protease RseP (regulator of RpoE activity)
VEKVLVLAPLVLCAACASSEPEPSVRGWLGGTYEPVVASSFPVGEGPWLDAHRTVGVPAVAEADRGALVAFAGAGSPLAQAGVRPGDLLLSVDGTAVGDADDVREVVEAKEPGSTAALRYLRDGAVHESTAVVGRETWRRQGTVRIGLSLGTTIDLWPFDDGINLLGLVVARPLHGTDPAGPAGTYLRGAYPGRGVPHGPLRGWETFLLVVGGGAQDVVVEQTP